MKKTKLCVLSTLILIFMVVAPICVSATVSTGDRSDSCLSSLGIAPGELSPAFSPTTYEYTAWVSEDVTSVKIPATPRSDAAAIAYVTGAKEIVPGTNTIKVCCGAADGTSSTYTIIVTCGGTAPEATENPDPVVTDPVDDGDTITIEGVIGDTSSEETDIFGDEEGADDESESSYTTSPVSFDSDGYLVYNGEQYVLLSEAPKSEISTEKYNNLYEQLQSEKSLNTKLMIAAIVVGVVLLFIIFNLIFRMKDNRSAAANVKREKEAVRADRNRKMTKESDKGISKPDEDDDFEIIDLD